MTLTSATLNSLDADNSVLRILLGILTDYTKTKRDVKRLREAMKHHGPTLKSLHDALTKRKLEEKGNDVETIVENFWANLRKRGVVS